MTPIELVDQLEYQIFNAEGHSGDWKYLNNIDKTRIRRVALYLVLEGWSK